MSEYTQIWSTQDAKIMHCAITKAYNRIMIKKMKRGDGERTMKMLTDTGVGIGLAIADILETIQQVHPEAGPQELEFVMSCVTNVIKERCDERFERVKWSKMH